MSPRATHRLVGLAACGAAVLLAGAPATAQVATPGSPVGGGSSFAPGTVGVSPTAGANQLPLNPGGTTFTFGAGGASSPVGGVVPGATLPTIQAMPTTSSSASGAGPVITPMVPGSSIVPSGYPWAVTIVSSPSQIPSPPLSAPESLSSASSGAALSSSPSSGATSSGLDQPTGAVASPAASAAAPSTGALRTTPAEPPGATAQPPGSAAEEQQPAPRATSGGGATSGTTGP